MILGNSVYFAAACPSPSKQAEEFEEACITKSSLLERQKRLSFGIQQLILKQLRRQAQWLIVKVFLAALSLTLIAFILP